MKPEDKAREGIDDQLRDCGWIVQDYVRRGDTVDTRLKLIMKITDLKLYF